MWTRATGRELVAIDRAQFGKGSCGHGRIDGYVVVKYDNIDYPGIVTDEDHDDVEVTRALPGAYTYLHCLIISRSSFMSALIT